MKTTGRQGCRGFTLIEVLIALAIVALAVGALLGTLTSAASNISYLHDKTLAEWVALDHLTEVRISQNMPDKGKRTGYSVLGGIRWQWEQEVTELPIKGLLRVDVRARSTGETVDDQRQAEKPTAQKDPDSTPSGGDTEKLNWTTTVTGVVSSARSDRKAALPTPLRGNIAAGPNNPGAVGTPVNPTNPGNPRVPVKPPAGER